MFLSVRQCAEVITRLHRLKVKVTLQGHVIYPSIRVRSIFAESFEQFSLNFTQMFLPVMTQLPRLKVKVTCQGIILEFRVRSISPGPFGRFSFKLHPNVLSMRQCAKPMTRLHRLKVKVTLQSHGIYPSIRVRSISPKTFERFSLNFTQMFLSLRWCA